MGIIFYNLFLMLYAAGARLISPWNRKAFLWLEGRKKIFEQIRSSGISSEHSVVWMHCASLGEFEQGRPLLEKIRSQYPSYKILLTFFSPSGYETRKQDSSADYVFYLPLDSKKNATRFIALTKPKLVFWVKYEYWYYYFHELKKRRVPTLLISGIFRHPQIFFKWYGFLHRTMLGCFQHLFVQNRQSEELLAAIGLTGNVSISGDTRFDRVTEIAEKFEPIQLVEKFCGHSKVIVAGSTWQEDEEELGHFANGQQMIKFILAPHEIDEDRLREVESLFKNSVRLSVLNDLDSASYENERANVLIIDNIGMLSRLYKYADIAYVGGGFGDDGVHNVLEAAVYGKPVVFGPAIEKYIEAAELVDGGGGFVVENALEAEATFNLLLSNQLEHAAACDASRNYVWSKRGATGKIIAFVQENRLLTNW